MLKPAHQYQDEINKKLYDIYLNREDRYKYFFSTSFFEPVEFQNNLNWYNTEIAVLDELGNLHGYFSYKIDRDIMCAHSIVVISFTESNLVFRELFKNIKFLCKNNSISKIRWRVTIDNPIEKTYDRIIKRFGGRVVGYYENEIRLWDNRLYDEKLYEIILNKG